MKNYKILIITAFSGFYLSCNNKSETTEAAFAFNGAVLQELYKETDPLTLEITNPENRSVDSIVYTLGSKRVAGVRGIGKATASLKNLKLGYHTIKAKIYSSGEEFDITERIELVPSVEPKLWSFEVINTYRHDSKAFTQGLEFYKDTLYEGTGQNGNSFLRKYNYKTGEVYKQVNLEQQYFGEGITVLNGKVYQLTYKSLVGFIYDAGSLKKIKSFNYDKQIEGWGMTNDGTYIYHSDGSEKIWKMDPETQKMIDYVNVYTPSGKIKSVNELEFVDGLIYGNIWQKNAIAVINYKTGAVEAIVNLSDLRNQITSQDADVLNGIAYNPKTKTFFVTGKNWDKLFEIRIKRQ